MNQRTRKLIGTILTLVMLAVYCVIATAVYLALLQGAPNVVVLVYFAVAGVAWCLPAMVIIRWMVKPDPGQV